jgi:hypothetical protein
MKVIILCGGQGTRLREETEYRPKPLVDVVTTCANGPNWSATPPATSGTFRRPWSR